MTEMPLPRSLVMWDDALLGYDLGDHPLDPVRLELTIALARDLGLFDRPGVRLEPPEVAGDELLELVHQRDYLAAVRSAPTDPHFHGWGLGTADTPVFERMHEASARVVGGTVAAAEAVWQGTAIRAVNLAGGLHHAMSARASGFCVYNDPAIAIARLLALGAERIAYLDIDVHHGDGVQQVFWDDARVITISLHQSPLTLFPGTGYPDETGGELAPGRAVNVALPPGTDDSGWLRAFQAVVPPLLRVFEPQLLFTQCGADSNRLDPLADLRLSVDGQRLAYLALRNLADELCQGRWVATGGGGYSLVQAVPRAWTHLLAVLTGAALDPATPIPGSWRALAARRRPGTEVPVHLTDGQPEPHPGQPGWSAPDDPVDRAVAATRRAVFPQYGLDPEPVRG